jgi:YfiH family protein
MMTSLKKIHWLNSTSPFKAELLPGLKFGFEGVGFTPPVNMHRVRQVHGSEVIEAQPQCLDQSTLPAADGLWTSTKNLRIGIKTADCLPIILLDKSRRGVCVLHAGWRGLAAGILQVGLRRMLQIGCASDDLSVLVGPSISLPNYQVGPEVVEAFWNAPHSDVKHSDLAFALYKSEADRWHIDLGGIAAMIAMAHDIQPSNIFVVRSCTFAHPNLWNSYRREGRVIASNWSWVEISG